MQEDVENQVHLAGLRALGIVDKVITGPYWRILEAPGSILDLNPYLLQMKLSLEEWCKDASGLLEGDKLFRDVEIHDDDIYAELMKQNRSTEGCSKLKRSVDMTSSGKNGLNIRTNASPKWDRTRCPEE